MPDRVQVKDLYKDRGYLPQINPTARPVDTFVSPATPIQDVRLLELAKAWAQVEPGLSKFAEERTVKQNQELTEEGRQAALKNKAQFKEAINQGQIPAGASPWFKAGYERQKATRTALEYDQALKTAYAQTDLSSKDDPDAVTKWMAEFTDSWMKNSPDAQANPEFGRIFSVLGARSQDSLQSLHAAERTKRIEEGLVQDTDFLLGASLDNGVDLLGNRSPTLGQDLANIVNDQVANGLSGQVANKLVAEAVIRKAVTEGDPTVLDVLDEVPSGSGTVSKIGWVKDRVQAAREQIASLQDQQARVANAKLKAEKENATDGLLSSGFQKIFENPFDADYTQEFNQLNLIDPEEATKLSSFQTSYIGALNAKNKVIEDPQLKTEMTLKAIKGELTNDDVVEAVIRHDIDADTAKSLMTDLIPKAREHKSVVNNPVVTRMEKDLRDVITKNELSDDFADQRTFRASEATSAFLEGMLKYKAANPAASDLDLLRYAKDLKNELLEQYRETSAEPLPKVDLNKIDPTKDTLFRDVDELKAAIEEAKATKGESGKLKAIADQYQMDVFSLMNAQIPLYKPKPTKK